MKKYLASFLFLFFITVGFSQEVITGYSTYYDDSFRKWIVYSDRGEGLLELVWPLQNDWSEWAFRLGQHSGTLRSTWNNTFDQWTVTVDGVEFRARTVFQGDYRRIEVRGEDIVMTLDFQEFDESWEGKAYPDYEIVIYTHNAGDRRDWDVEQYSNYEIPLGFQVAATFLPILFVTPKY